MSPPLPKAFETQILNPFMLESNDGFKKNLPISCDQPEDVLVLSFPGSRSSRVSPSCADPPGLFATQEEPLSRPRSLAPPPARSAVTGGSPGALPVVPGVVVWQRGAPGTDPVHPGSLPVVRCTVYKPPALSLLSP